MSRSVALVSPSNVPVANREASIFTGAAIAEYYRDMGYNIFLTVDTMGRWAEALREISVSLGDAPGGTTNHICSVLKIEAIRRT